MKKFKITSPDGREFIISAPEGATPDQLKSKAQSLFSQAGSKAQTPGNPGTEPGMIAKGWKALNKPAEMSREGWDMVSQSETVQPNLTGNRVTDVIRGTPQVLAETARDAAPGFIDNVAIATAGAGAAVKGAGKVAGAALSKAAPMLEAGSGLQKGTLVQAFKDPKMIVDFGRKLKAQEMYNEVKQGATVPKTLLEARNTRIVDKAVKSMAEGKQLTAPDAFHARKAVRALIKANQKSKAYNDDFLLQAEEGLTAMVFQSANKADKLYQSAIRGEQMRNLSRLNKNGTTGPISAAIMAKIPALAPLLSPAVQGAGASLAGAAAQMPMTVPLRAGAMVGAGLDRLTGKKEKEKRRGKR